MGSRNPSHDGQAQPRTPSVLMRLSVGFKDAGEGVLGDTDARVLDLELELGIGIDNTDHDTPTAWSKADCVRAEVDKKLVESLLVSGVCEIGSATLPLQYDARFLGLGMELLDDASGELRQVERLAIDLNSSPKPRQLDDLVRESKQALTTLSDDVRQSLLFLREGAGRPGVKEVNRAADGGERRSQLMGDRRKELLLRLIDLTEPAGHRVE